MFRDSYEDFKDLGAEVIAIRADSEKAHKQFATKYALPFVLLADTENKVRKLFGIKGNIFGLLPGRETYVVNRLGKVIMVFNALNANQHKNRVLKAPTNEKESK